MGSVAGVRDCWKIDSLYTLFLSFSHVLCSVSSPTLNHSNISCIGGCSTPLRPLGHAVDHCTPPIKQSWARREFCGWLFWSIYKCLLNFCHFLTFYTLYLSPHYTSPVFLASAGAAHFLDPWGMLLTTAHLPSSNRGLVANFLRYCSAINRVKIRWKVLVYSANYTRIKNHNEPPSAWWEVYRSQQRAYRV